jgi:hypothetical protein
MIMIGQGRPSRSPSSPWPWSFDAVCVEIWRCPWRPRPWAAGSLSGAKGGRPRRSPPRTSAFGRASGEPITPDDVVEHVQHLIRMGAQGNPEARSRLVEIDQEIRSWLHLEVSRFATSRSAGYERRLRGSPQPMDMESAAE